ncbi:MAG TPA: hypothetical protein VGN25_09955 [Solirubrobacteraceae bacterium]|nr:hypothetical protein [Solirubrobacteraceae bacterium]
MPRPSRPLPRIGAQVRIVHFSGERELAKIVAVHNDGRRLEIRCAGGELLDFELSPATARFVSAASAQGPRLELLDAG